MTYFSKIKTNNFLKSVLTLSVGTGLAQLVGLISLPLLSRFYTPEAFAVLGVFISVGAIFAIFGNAGYELAIMLPEKRSDRLSLLGFSFWVAFLIALLSISSYFFIDYFEILSKESLKVFLLVPFGVFFESCSQALKVWLNKEKKYKSIARARLWQAVSTAVVSIGIGVLQSWNWGLVVGLVLGIFVKFLFYLLSSELSLKTILSIDFERTKNNLKKYNHFFKFGIGGTALNTISRQLPFFILPIYFGEYFTGQFAMAMKVIMLPIGLVAVAIGDVFYEKANNAFQESELALGKISKRTFLTLLPMSTLILIIGIPLAPWAFTFVLGDQWLEAGEIARFLLPWIAVMFITSPLSFLIDVRQKLKFQLLYNTVLFAFRLLILLFGAWYISEMSTLKYFGMGNAVLVACYLLYLLKLGYVRFFK